ncbi:ATP-binding protein [Gimesia sp.]|uniref:ATP-binding protein n=1 Tax=Gimesia sp. TaxID=2024833 RepID=UPI003A8ED77F
MVEFFSKLFDTSDYPARWNCGAWTSGEGWLHILSDVGTWSAYTAIPVVLLYFTFKRRDIPYTRLFGLFAAFILLCGAVHLVEAIIFWYPIYRISGLLKLATAIVSWAAVIVLIKYMPHLLKLPTIAATNTRLLKEVEQRKDIERDLRWMQSRYEAFLNSTSSIIWTTDPQGNFIVPQISWQRFTGQTWEDHQGDGWLKALLPEDRAELSALWNKPTEKHTSYRVHGHIWHAKSESYRPVITEAVPVYDQEGQILEWVGTVSDIHEQRMAEESLIAAEAESSRQKRELELIYDTAPVGMGLVDREYRYLRINDTLARINGIPREAHLGRVYFDLVPGIADRIKPLYEKVFRTGKAVKNQEVRGTTPASEKERCWLVNYHPLSHKNGEVWGVSSIVQDITARKEMEEALRDSEQQASQANLAKSEFLANMSHEIRTPMAAVLGYADVLLGHLKDPDNLNCVMIMKRNGEHLLELINDILDLSRIEAGKLEVDLKETSLRELIADVQTLMQVRADEKNLMLNVKFAGKVPELIITDATRLRQILINLIGNAIKFTDHGEVRLVIRLLTDFEKPIIEFAVQDTGIGMSEEQIQRLFKPFSQGDSSVTRAYGGSGLGLAISKRLVQMLKGQLKVKSEVGQGSVFRVRLPAGSIKGIPLIESGILERKTDRAESVPKVHRLNCRVLVVDDRREVRHISQHFLEKAGASVTSAEDGQQGIDLALIARDAGDPFDVILMDMQMPQVDGLQAIAELRAAGLDSPIIALTADAMKGDRERCLQGGCDDYLSKPVDHAQMVEMVWRYSEEVTAEALHAQRQKQTERFQD